MTSPAFSNHAPGNDAAEGNVVSLLRATAAARGSKPAIVFHHRHADLAVSFAELWDRVDRCSVAARALGLVPGDRAVVMIPMSVDLYVVMLGLIKAGVAAVFVDPWVGMDRIAAFAAFAEPKAYVGVPGSHLLRLLRAPLRRLPVTVTTGATRLGFPARYSLPRLLAGQGEDGAVFAAHPEDPALITFTTGSGGVPKGANRTHRHLLAQYRALNAEFPQSVDEADMTMFPVFALRNLAAGVTTVIPPMDFRHVAAMDARMVWDRIVAHQVRSCTASPPFFDRLAAHLARSRPATMPLRRILTGGAPVTSAQLRQWQSVFPAVELVVAYGSTEAEPVAHIRAEERLVVEASDDAPAPGYCVGRPATSVQTRVIRIRRGAVPSTGDWSAEEMPPGEIGELVVAGDHVCRDYFRNPEATRENKLTGPDGTVWHRMGDTGRFDADGRFWLAGRVHSTMFRGGAAVHAQLVEQAAARLAPAAQAVAAVGLPDAKLGERVILVVQARPGGVDPERLRTELARQDIPVDEVRIQPAPLPVDPRHNAKIDYERLRQQCRRR